MTDPRVVIDTNVLISKLISDDSVPGLAVTKALQTYTLIFSNETLEELRSVLHRKKFDRYTPLEQRLEYIPYLLLEADVLTIDPRFTSCRDPRDNKFLDLAVQGDARLIISGDEDLQALNPFLGIAIVSPAQFLTSQE